MDETIYQVKTENFEGPLDVLLSLIEKKKMHISDVSLADVTDDYVNYVRGNLENDLPNVTLFLSIAATLVLIKSKTLLGGALTNDDDVVNAEHNLEERLKLLELLRNGTNSYQKSMISPYVDFLKRRPITSQSFSPYESINLENLNTIAHEIVDKLPEEKEKLPKVAILRVMTLEEMITKITKNINQIKGKTSFNKISQFGQIPDMSDREKKVSVIVSFLAVLELVRGGLLDAEQTGTYGDIMCEPVISISNIG
jgi:segregation and condensation protein A